MLLAAQQASSFQRGSAWGTSIRGSKFVEPCIRLSDSEKLTGLESVLLVLMTFQHAYDLANPGKQDLFTKLTRMYCSYSHRYSTSEIALFSKQKFALLQMSKAKYSALTSTGCAFVICRAMAVFSPSKDSLLQAFGKCWLFRTFSC